MEGESEWSEWVPFADAVASAPRSPGVYMAREGQAGEVVYIGMAGERRGGGKPQGIRGRLSIYASGKGLVSGLGEAVFDRALADPEWVRARLHELETSGPRRAKHLGGRSIHTRRPPRPLDQDCRPCIRSCTRGSARGGCRYLAMEQGQRTIGHCPNALSRVSWADRPDMIPDLDLARVRKWIDQRNAEIPPRAQDQIRFEIDVADRTITVLECRPPWREDFGPDWTRSPICRLRYTKVRKEWSLYWSDRNLKFHEYDLVPPTPHLDVLIEEVKRDRTGIFWG